MSPCVYVLNKKSPEGDFTSQSCSDGNEMYKKGCCRCTVKPIAFVTSSLLLPSSLLKLPFKCVCVCGGGGGGGGFIQLDPKTRRWARPQKITFLAFGVSVWLEDNVGAG